MKALLESMFHRRTLAVIGTAGRRDDGDKLTMDHWNRMVETVHQIVAAEKITRLVSGGAAWADHAAVQVHLETGIPLILYIPGNPEDIRVSDWYHRNFSTKLFGRKRITWDEVLDCRCITGEGGFKDRNSQVAAAADVYLAMTFGEGEKVKDGGTADTVRKMRRRGVTGYHFNLNDLTIY